MQPRVKNIPNFQLANRLSRISSQEFLPLWLIKGQMNQKIDIFSFVALPLPNSKKNHPKWDLGKDFLPKHL